MRAIVNRSYQLSESRRVSVETLNKNTSTPRVVKKVEAMFQLMPDTVPLFDHFTPAAWLIRNPDVLTGESTPVEQTLNVAENVFKTFNRLLD